jgi:hypothetical protein
VECDSLGDGLIRAARRPTVTPGPSRHVLSTLAGMADDPQTDRSADEESFVAAYDLDGDGEVSAVEDARAVLGLADARLEQIAEEGGAKGKLAEAAHKIVDKLDND